MTNGDVARIYLECFCNADVAGLREVLDPGLHFSGPLHQFESASDYLASLQETRLEKSSYELIESAESENGVLVFYQYIKPTSTVLVAQLFRLHEGKINEILVVFDTGQVV
jgi:hypothetical protein